ncbi:MAG: hypothetical protein ABIH50_08165 [bacterium]
MKINFLERTALAWGIGLGLLGMEMFVLSLFDIPLNLLTSSLPALIIIGIFLLFLKPKIKLNILLPNISITESILFILIAVIVIYVFFDALVKPIVNFDDLWRQGAIAKLIFTTGKVLTPQAIELAGPHPYLNPLSQAWIYMGIGTWNDAIGKIVFPLCFVALILIFYFNLRQEMDRLKALFFTLLLTSFPLIIYHVGTAYSDFMQTFYYSVGVIYLFRWMRINKHSFLCFSAIYFGLGCFVKQLGIPLWIIAYFILLLYIFLENRQENKSGLTFLVTTIIVAFPWLINPKSSLISQFQLLINKMIPVASNNQPAILPSISTALPYGTPSLVNIINQISKRMFTYADWQILWFVLIIVLIFNWRQIWGSKLKLVFLIILLNLLLIIYAFTEQNAYNFLIDGTLVERIMMYQIPVVLFLIALCSNEKYLCPK